MKTCHSRLLSQRDKLTTYTTVNNTLTAHNVFHFTQHTTLSQHITLELQHPRRSNILCSTCGAGRLSSRVNPQFGWIIHHFTNTFARDSPSQERDAYERRHEPVARYNSMIFELKGLLTPNTAGAVRATNLNEGARKAREKILERNIARDDEAAMPAEKPRTHRPDAWSGTRQPQERDRRRPSLFKQRFGICQGGIEDAPRHHNDGKPRARNQEMETREEESRDSRESWPRSTR